MKRVTQMEIIMKILLKVSTHWLRSINENKNFRTSKVEEQFRGIRDSCLEEMIEEHKDKFVLNGT